MLEKGKNEKHEEQVQFAAFKQFCDDTTAEKKTAIAEAEETIEILKADIQKYAADAEQLAKEIAEHEADIAVWTGDIKAATKVRGIEKADYDATHKDYTESVEALQMAIEVLKKQAHDRKQASSLAQVSALKSVSLIPDEAKRAIDAFISQDPDAGLDVAAPEANAYEFQSHGIIEMLEKLLDKFIDERTTLEKEEMNARHAFEMLVQDLKAQIDAAEQDVSEKSATKAKKLQAKADAEGELQDTTTTMEADKKYLAELTATCEQKASDFESRQQLRAEELEAIEKAIEILSSDAVSGNAEKHLPTMLQTKKAALSQLRADGRSPTQQRVAQYLRDQGRNLNSRVLSALAVRVEDDPFKKVKKMIKDLIVRLMESANEEAEHKGWCDTELATNEQTRKEKTMAVETLHAEIDELEASVAKLTEEIAELTKAVAELDAAMAKATEIRAAEKEKNTETIKDAQDAQTAVAQALVILKEFYAKAAEATALVQQKQEPPAIFDSPYKGMQAENGGVVGMLEVIESDFARLESETKAAEATAQKEYDEFMTDSEVDKAAKEKDIEHKTGKKQDQEQALVTKKADVEGTQKELNAALDYFEKLKPSCVSAGVTFEDRVARRKEEIESLQEALKILNGESA
jgi:cell division septum initiation protein DivIVA